MESARAVPVAAGPIGSASSSFSASSVPGRGKDAGMAILTGLDLECVRGRRPVFRDVAFRLEPGQALVLAGANGVGKSSLLRIMAGLLHPQRGRLAWDGAAVDDHPAAHRDRLSFVGHLDGVKAPLTAAENLTFWAALQGVSEPGRAARAALERMDAGHLADVPARFLSQGQRRRLALSRLLLRFAPLWLLDEPVTALDRAGQARLEEAIAAHRDAGGLVALSTHHDLAVPGARRLDLGDYRAWDEEEA